MTCPKCGGATLIYDTKHPEGGVTRRRRRCQACGYRFNTEERYIAPVQKYKKTEAKV